MGLGTTAISTNAKKEIPGPPSPPFDPSSADNGLSVNNASGRIVLGNDLGDIAAPAQLLSDRDIQMEDSGGNQYRIFLTSLFAAVQTAVSGYSLEILGQDNTTPSITVGGGNNVNAEIALIAGTGSAVDINMQATSGTVSHNMVCGNDSLQWLVDGSGAILFGISDFGIPITVMQFYTATQTMQLGSPQVAANGATVQIAGTLNRRYLRSSKGANYNVDRDTDSDLMFTNSAAVIFTMPNMVGANDRPGFIFRVHVNNAAGVTVQAAGGQTIHFGSLASSSGGTVASVTVGSSVTLQWDGTSGWIAEAFTGVWNFT